MKPKRVLFICTVNRNRSVVAEYFLRDLLSKQKGPLKEEVEVWSAGMGYSPEQIRILEAEGKFWDRPVFGLSPYPYIIETMKRRGHDLASKISKEMTRATIVDADLIIVFTRYQKEKIMSLYGSTDGRVFTIQEFVDYTGYLVSRDDSFPGWSYDDETKGWFFPDSLLEGSTTEIEHMVWWGMDKFTRFLSQS